MVTPNEELVKALNSLESFTDTSSKPISRFKEVKDLLQTLFFSKYRQEKRKQERTVKQELLKSVTLVKKYLPLIEKYAHGTPEETRFAETVNRTIHRYNQALKNGSNEKELAIDATHRVAYKKIESSGASKIQHLFFKKREPKTPPTQHELDTLKMKAIRMIESDPSFQEALIETLKDKESGNSEEIDEKGNQITLMQTWSALPGEVHRIIGAFKREAKHSIPIKDSFKVFLESKQTGHPYPAQHMGWALSHWLIPSSALWIDKIPLLLPIIERKKNLAKALLPQGDKNLKARNLYRVKKILFEEGRLEFLTFHQELANAIISSSPESDNATSYKIIKNFFKKLIMQPSPFSDLASVNEEMNLIFVEAPFEKIEEHRLAGYENDLFTTYDAERRLTFENWKTSTPAKTPFEKARLAYLELMGLLFGNSAALLLKLQLSEKISLKPLPLSDFELKMQACAYKHLLEFLDEMDEEADLNDPHEQAALKQRMKVEILSEIELFSSPTFEEIDPFLQELTEETVCYFHERFHSHES